MFNLFKKKDSGLNSEVIELSANMILCFESYLMQHYKTSLTPQEMDAIVESTLMFKGIETDQLEFMLYCASSMDEVVRKSKSNKTYEAALRTQIDFDKSFKNYCIDHGFTRLIEMERKSQSAIPETDIISNYETPIKASAATKAKRAVEVLNKDKLTQPIPSESLITEQDREAFGPDLIDLMNRIFNDAYNCLFNESTRLLITDEDFEAFGLDLISTIINIHLQAICVHQSNNQFINRAINKSTETFKESFGPDLVDLILRTARQNIESKKLLKK